MSDAETEYASATEDDLVELDEFSVTDDLFDSISIINHTTQQESMAKQILYKMLLDKQHFVDSIASIEQNFEQRDAFQRVLFFEVKFLFLVALWEVGGHKDNPANSSLPRSLGIIEEILLAQIGNGDETIASILKKNKFELFGVINASNSFFFEILELSLAQYSALMPHFSGYVSLCKQDPLPNVKDIEEAILSMLNSKNHSDFAVSKFFELCKIITPDYTSGN